jgi:glycine/D-amino acid oxidase-like deaminating enzyme
MDVTILERDEQCLGRASRVNQARVHGGYHYPRSLMTAFRSRYNYVRWKQDYQEAICDSFTKLYAIGKTFSKVTAGQFALFMKRIGAPLAEASSAQRKLFNWNLVEGLWVAEECAFDYSILRDIVIKKIEEAKIPIRFGADAHRLVKHGQQLVLTSRDGSSLTADWVINATYSGINRLEGEVERIPLKHELTEMALVELPNALKGLSLTMMCGPFFSFMPYPAEKLTSLSHVRYTPHAEWYECTDGAAPEVDPYQRFERAVKNTAYAYMLADAARYLPALNECRYDHSIWEVKTLLPKSEADDGRPILFRRDAKSPNLLHVMGGKIDNIFDVGDELQKLLKSKS